MLGLVNTGIGCYLYFSAITRLPAQTVAACDYVEPLTAVLLSAAMLGESMAPSQLFGAALVIADLRAGELYEAARDGGDMLLVGEMNPLDMTKAQRDAQQVRVVSLKTEGVPS